MSWPASNVLQAASAGIPEDVEAAKERLAKNIYSNSLFIPTITINAGCTSLKQDWYCFFEAPAERCQVITRKQI